MVKETKDLVRDAPNTRESHRKHSIAVQTCEFHINSVKKVKTEAKLWKKSKTCPKTDKRVSKSVIFRTESKFGLIVISVGQKYPQISPKNILVSIC